MDEKIEPLVFTPHTSDVGHTCVIDTIGSGKTVPAELARLWAAGHPGGSSSLAPADDSQSAR